MVSKKFFILMFIFVLAGSVSAAETYKQGDMIDLKQSCYNGGALCSASAACNITVVSQNNATVLVNAGGMSSQGGYFNYTLNNQIYPTGTYRYDITCTDSGSSAASSFNFDITPNGENLSTADSIIYIFMLVLSVCIFLGFTYAALMIDSKNYRDEEGYLVKINWKRYMRIFCGMMAYVTAIWLTWTSYNIILAYAGIQQAAQFFYFLHVVLYSLLVPVIAVSCIFVVIRLVRDAKLHDQIKRGLFVQ